MATRASTRSTRKRAPKKTLDALAEYRRKRDFERTEERSGSTEPPHESGTLHCGMRKHHASLPHCELRLEVKGVMRSWAVPKGPSRDPSVKRLTMQVEDHPMA